MATRMLAAAALAALVGGCVTPGTTAQYEDISGKPRGENLRQIDVAACMKDLADHRSANNLVDAVSYMTVCMQSKGWRITGWKKPDGSISGSPFG